MKTELPHLRWGGELKVEVALLREDSRGRVFFDPRHRSRSQVMSDTSDKMKDGIHDAAVKVKDAAHNVAEKTEDAAHDVGVKVKDAAHNVAEKTKDVVHNVGEKIKDASD
jgi:gas vesicle protein